MVLPVMLFEEKYNKRNDICLLETNKSYRTREPIITVPSLIMTNLFLWISLVFLENEVNDLLS